MFYKILTQIYNLHLFSSLFILMKGLCVGVHLGTLMEVFCCSTQKSLYKWDRKGESPLHTGWSASIRKSWPVPWVEGFRNQETHLCFEQEAAELENR